MLYTKCIHSPIEPADGYRISVMSRHTLNDGKTPDPRITDESFQWHMRGLAPPIRLLGDYYKRGMPWERFEARYREFLDHRDQKVHIVNLARYGLRAAHTILCVEPTPEQCHRRLIAEACKRVEPRLEIIVR